MTENPNNRGAHILSLGQAIGAFADEEYEAALQHLDNACFDNTDDMYYQTCRLKYLVYRKLDKKEEADSVLHKLSVLANDDPEKRYENVFFARDVCNKFNDPDLAEKLIKDFSPDDPYYQEELRGVRYLINRLRSGSSWGDDLAFLAKARYLTIIVDSVATRLIEKVSNRQQATQLLSALETKVQQSSSDKSIWTDHITTTTKRLSEFP